MIFNYDYSLIINTSSHTTMLHEITGNLGEYSLQENIKIINVIDVWNKSHLLTRDNIHLI